LKKSNRLLMTYQWENMLRLMQIKFNASNLPTVKIGNFRAVLKETLLSSFCSNYDGNPYLLEIVINLPNHHKSYFMSNLKEIPFSHFISSHLFFRLKFPKENKFYNDRTSLDKLVGFYPEFKEKVRQEDVQYSDLIELAESMFKSFRSNYADPENIGKSLSVNGLTYFIREGLADFSQTQNSRIGNISDKYTAQKFPILLCRKTLTVNPMRLAVIMLPSADTIEFCVYSLASNAECSKVITVADCEVHFPFLRMLLSQHGFRESIGDRLLATYKNTLLVELFIKEETAGHRDEPAWDHKLTLARGER
jgi:hypothetical protein